MPKRIPKKIWLRHKDRHFFHETLGEIVTEHFLPWIAGIFKKKSQY